MYRYEYHRFRVASKISFETLREALEVAIDDHRRGDASFDCIVYEKDETVCVSKEAFTHFTYIFKEE